MLRTTAIGSDWLGQPRAKITSTVRPSDDARERSAGALAILMVTASAVAGYVLSAPEWIVPQAGSVAFFFFFFNSFGALPPAPFVPTNWAAVGRFVAADTPILVGLAREDSMPARSALPVKWQPVTSIADANGVTWSLFATEVVPLGKETPWKSPADVVRGLVSRGEANGGAGPTVDEEDGGRWLDAMFRFAVVRADVAPNDLPSWLAPRAARPLADGAVNVALFPGRTATLTHHVDEDGSVLFRLADQERSLATSSAHSRGCEHGTFCLPCRKRRAKF